MTNAEKYKDEIIEEYQNLLKIKVIDGDGNRMNKAIKAIAYKHCGKQLCGASSTFKWLCEEYKEPIKLTRTEYSLLRHVYKLNYKYIARDKNGDISVYLDEPDKDILTEIWHGKEYEFTLFNSLFKFVKWEDLEPTSIKEVLDNCEVVEDEL